MTADDYPRFFEMLEDLQERACNVAARYMAMWQWNYDTLTVSCFSNDYVVVRWYWCGPYQSEDHGTVAIPVWGLFRPDAWLETEQLSIKQRKEAKRKQDEENKRLEDAQRIADAMALLKSKGITTI